MRRNTRRTTKRNSKTVISPRSRTPPPRPSKFSRDVFRMVLLGLGVSAALGLGRPAVAGGNLPPGETKHEVPYALIFGTVWGPDDHPVYAVRIKIRRENEQKA